MLAHPLGWSFENEQETTGLSVSERPGPTGLPTAAPNDDNVSTAEPPMWRTNPSSKGQWVNFQGLHRSNVIWRPPLVVNLLFQALDDGRGPSSFLSQRRRSKPIQYRHCKRPRADAIIPLPPNYIYPAVNGTLLKSIQTQALERSATFQRKKNFARSCGGGANGTRPCFGATCLRPCAKYIC